MKPVVSAKLLRLSPEKPVEHKLNVNPFLDSKNGPSLRPPKAVRRNEIREIHMGQPVARHLGIRSSSKKRNHGHQNSGRRGFYGQNLRHDRVRGKYDPCCRSIRLSYLWEMVRVFRPIFWRTGR